MIDKSNAYHPSSFRVSASWPHWDCCATFVNATDTYDVIFDELCLCSDSGESFSILVEPMIDREAFVLLLTDLYLLIDRLVFFSLVSV
jgi:hypothetical protein